MRHDVVRPAVRDVVVRARRIPANVEAQLVDLLTRENVDHTVTVTADPSTFPARAGEGEPC